MLGKIRSCGNWLRSVQGWLWFVVVVVPAAITYWLGWLEDLPLAVKFTVTMAALLVGILVAYYGLRLFDLLFPKKRPRPLLEVWEDAEKHGWDFKADPNLHVLDFVLALQQSGCRGELIFEGRAARSQVESLIRNEPLQQIEANYWVDHLVEWSRIFSGEGEPIGNFTKDNFDCFSYNQINSERVYERYYDLHASGATTQWFKKVASMFVGRNAKQQEERAKRFKEQQEIQEGSGG